MTIEDVAARADAWSKAIKTIVKAISAAGIAICTAVAALIALWPSGDTPNPPPPPPAATVADGAAQVVVVEQRHVDTAAAKLADTNLDGAAVKTDDSDVSGQAAAEDLKHKYVLNIGRNKRPR